MTYRAARLSVRQLIAEALPAPLIAIGGSLVWGTVTAASAALALLLKGWTGFDLIARPATLFFVGGLIAFAPALFAARLSGRNRPEPAFAAAVFALAVITIGVTGLLNGLVFREYFSTWHEPVTTRLGANEFVFTVLSGVYQFLVLGVRLFLPLGLPALLVASFLIARDVSNRA